MEELEAKVTNVLDDTSIALNRGSKHGVERGDEVYLWNFVDVKDPDNGVLLGIVRREKLKMTVVDVYDNFCVAEVPRVNLTFGTLAFDSQPKKTISNARSGSKGTVTVVEGDQATIMLPDESVL